jgi:hypothetical protein
MPPNLKKNIYTVCCISSGHKMKGAATGSYRKGKLVYKLEGNRQINNDNICLAFYL